MTANAEGQGWHKVGWLNGWIARKGKIEVKAPTVEELDTILVVLNTQAESSCKHKWRTSTKGQYQEWRGELGAPAFYRYIEICLDCRNLFWSEWMGSDA